MTSNLNDKLSKGKRRTEKKPARPADKSASKGSSPTGKARISGSTPRYRGGYRIDV